MAAIELETQVEHQPQGIGIPELVRWKTEQERRCTRRITIEARDKKGKFGKVNGFRLSVDKSNDYFPTQEVDEICEAIMWAVEAAYEARKAEQEDLGALDFKLTFDQQKPDGKRSRPSCEFAYDPNGPDTSQGSAPRSGDDEFRIATTGALLDLVRSLTVHLDNAHGRIIESNRNQGTEQVLAAMGNIMGLMGQTYAAGIEMHRRALDFMYNTRRIEEESAAADRRQERLFKFLEVPLKVGMKQLAQMLGKKMKAAGIEVDLGEAKKDERKDEEPAEAAEEDLSAGQPTAGDDDAQPQVQHAGAEIMRSFGLLILPTQWPQISTILTRKQMATFSALFAVKTDREASLAWKKVEDGAIPLDKLLALSDLLTTEQRSHFEDVKRVMSLLGESEFDDDGVVVGED